MEAQFSRLPGGKYRCRQAPDGTWDIYDVPVFSIVEKGEKNAPRDITEADLRHAVESHQRQFREDQYLARANVLHNFGIQKARPAGFFLPQSVRPFRFRGQTRPVVFADLIAVPGEVFRELDHDGLPYCSVEVRTYEPLTFGALALLDTEPPYFEFPLITTGDKQFAEVASAVAVPEAQGYRTPVAVACFRFAEDTMPDDMNPEKKDDEKPEAEMAEGGASEALDQAASGLEAIMEPLMAIKAMLEKLTGAGGEEAVPVEGEGPIDEPVAAMSAKLASLEGRVAGLQQYRADREGEDKRDAMFAKAVTGLERDGYAVTDNLRARLRKLTTHGDAAFNAFVDSYRETATQDPDNGIGGHYGATEQLPSEVLAYQSRGPEMFSAAVKAHREWLELPDDAYRSPLESFLKREVS